MDFNGFRESLDCIQTDISDIVFFVNALKDENAALEKAIEKAATTNAALEKELVELKRTMEGK